MKRLLIVSIVCICAAMDAEAKSCAKCTGSGFVRTFIQCECCEGCGTIKPERLGKSAGVTRYTVTTYWTGMQSVDNVRTKKYSENPCPVCASSSRRGNVKVSIPCEVCDGCGCVEEYTAFDLKRMVAVLKSHVKCYDKFTATVNAANKKYKSNNTGMIETIKKLVAKRNDAIKSMSADTDTSTENIEKRADEVRKLSTELADGLKMHRAVEMLLKHGVGTASADREELKDDGDE